MQDFSVEGGVRQMFGGFDFLRMEQNFTIGQSPKIWGNFLKYSLKLIKILKKCKTKGNFQENF